MRKIVFLFFFTISLGVTAFAADADDAKAMKQLKKDMVAAKDALKNATDMEKGDNAARSKLSALERSENTMRGYLADKRFAARKDIHMLLVDLLRKQYEVGNNKMYLKLNTDTACYVKTGRRLFLAIEALDSVDAQPNDKGVSAPSYRKRHSEFLAPSRVNLFRGGVYFFKHKQMGEAWQCFDMYLNTREWPLFESAKLDSANDGQAAYYAVLAAMDMPDMVKTKKYADEAIDYKPHRERILKLLSEFSLAKGDSADYIKYVTTGFNDKRDSEYFFPRLIDYYTGRGDYATSFKYVDEAMQKDSTNEFVLLAKHGVLLAEKRYDEALYYAYRILQKNDSIPVLNYNVGFIYYSKALKALKETGVPYRKRMVNAQKFYKQLLPYMEHYRKEAPDDRERWYPILYDTYLNLNMGKEFNDLEK